MPTGRYILQQKHVPKLLFKLLQVNRMKKSSVLLNTFLLYVNNLYIENMSMKIERKRAREFIF